MSKADSLKEAIGWLKVVFGLLVAIDISLIAWLAQNLARADGILLVMAWAATIGTNLGIIGICAVAYRLINDLKDV
jgi:thiazole synthase ThiGH ThiG subunit